MAREVTRDFLLRLPPELFRELEREAKSQGTNRTQLVRKALFEYFDKRDLVGDLMSERAKELAPKARAATQK
jgi:metal-responsive CopG/Arc/MetJ family transcriptional regulator